MFPLGFWSLVFMASPEERPAIENIGWIFSYRIESGRLSHFESGYRDHLDWHRRHKDHMAWYGWFVANGPRMGTFIDGTFGHRFDASKNRVDPQGDQEHFQQFVAPFVTPANRTTYEHLTAASTSRFLEEREKPEAILVYRLTLAVGCEDAFRKSLVAIRSTFSNQEQSMAFSWYKVLEGDRIPTYVLMIPMGEGYANVQTATAVVSNMDGNWRGLVTSLETETWSYRNDLSYFP
ncbi:hypothetical protein SCOR_00355 [Sulfidibacter corallicola]|uniref:Uncharacterized protein n=1 Tax=Sulfidibacter corallicola TaxID=2818388 RepID=A0A8A4THB5_SULCO|nr:hypothetical protein [Sulfidibacter corallicola]QTD49023.1 hypothetical protein J3U87_25845 [Sulfidibacter corallicola]